MKSRNGFVSNSSSTSFLVLTSKKCCECCGLNMFEIFEDILEKDWSADSSSTTHHIEEYIKTIEDDIGCLKREIAGLNKDPDYVQSQGVGYTITNGSRAKWKQEELDRLEECLAKAVNGAKENNWLYVSNVDISYHNPTANTMFEAMKDKEIIEVI